ncbi:hypothetical protein NL676_033027 [Syzygium grande]|nr:hypothetical protein NL676_033027 [Syzygium grande]
MKSTTETRPLKPRYSNPHPPPPAPANSPGRGSTELGGSELRGFLGFPRVCICLGALAPGHVGCLNTPLGDRNSSSGWVFRWGSGAYEDTVY